MDIAPITFSEENIRDLFAIFAPRPTEEQMKRERERDQRLNPYNDGYGKPILRGEVEIECDLRYLYAEEMMLARKRNRKELMNGLNSGRKPSPIY